MASEDSNIINVFIPCQMDMFQTNTAFSVMEVLSKLNIHCQYMDEQTCCGRRLFMEGDMDSAKTLATQVVDQLGTVQMIVIPDSSCAGFMRSYYRSMLVNTFQSTELTKFKNHIFELCDYIVNIRKVECLGNTFCHRVYYFKSCSARNLYPQNDAAEILLRNTAGLDLETDNDYHGCCGAHGRFPNSNPQAAEKMALDILNKAYNSGSRIITSTDIHCLQMLDAYASKHGIDIDVMHIADILNGE